MFRRLVVLFLIVLAVAGCDSEGEGEVNLGAHQSGAGLDVDALELSIDLEANQMDWIGAQIFQNECAGQLKCLVHWNEGERFPSLGIGHFIWYPEGVDERFVESFPALIQYMKQRQASVPDWLRRLEEFDAPWPTREAFMAAQDSPEVAELREFLAGTQGLQAEFIVARADQSLAAVVASAPESQRRSVMARLKALAATPGGLYAVIDYVNFKGEGLSPDEQYKGQRWGLLQVLLAMEEQNQSLPALVQFRDAADQVLTRRAENAPKSIEKERWLTGWRKRLMTYREPSKMF
ncbi:hypothetical protein LPB19_09730 [Marinobacter salinisoli]|uniref:DUF3080 domain-containing protein n=1 Tax=Marinobacter salinisoli TaxID=2769486 RepID=A0ABX7MYL3_9GAMM|nr:hypothetical protein [Marinobacter salinisoli]QSP96530.1 hypothetical protein LPB19_09730 [Marinobacter salinisoli]